MSRAVPNTMLLRPLAPVQYYPGWPRATGNSRHHDEQMLQWRCLRRMPK